ncbi:HpsJ family protein [Calothrix rhizosoleniae]|uniref:HpsJ-like protein, cyanoexosortase A-associated n=1 Tax=Calothrix rhizosoleniae TaxID=888997 RepID=UPI000B49C037|nr:HpsJ family protein [Calothrix rhizosoleniae]
MTKSSEKPIPLLPEIEPLLEQIHDFTTKQTNSINIIRALGYGLFLLALFDWVVLFIPTKFIDPAWEFQTMGAIIERVPVPLIALALIFFGEANFRGKLELRLLKLISSLTLLLAMLFFLLIPVGTINAIRLSENSQTKIVKVSEQQTTRAENVEKQISKATPAQISNLLKSRGRSLDGKNPKEVKNQILSQVSTAKKRIKTQAQAAQSAQEINLFKRAVKWNLGALVSGTLFIYFWVQTRWVRKIKTKSKSLAKSSPDC